MPLDLGVLRGETGLCFDVRASIHNRQEAFEKIYNVSGDFLYVTNVSPQDFSDIEKERSLRRRKFRYRRYQAGFKTLIVTIPTRVHERLHLELYAKVYSKIMTMGLADGWAAMGGTTLRAQGQHPGVDVGEGDSTGGPCQRSGLLDWPTLWFSASDHQVKIVLLAKLDENRREIILENWKEDQASSRPGAMTTRRAALLEPRCSQAIRIVQDPINPGSYNVTSGALRLEFQLLFERDPRSGEGDVIIDVPALENYAERLWAR
ncbi:hypothetical protein F4819DRAFT_494536 [Hypoxylon fuscum]|nr:hypothetical protein F4819DRAFT_494536 [Hypoxylon fuscum]